MATNPFVPQVASSSGSNGNRWVTSPKQLPIFNITDSSLYVKNSASTSQVSNAAAFYTAAALEGASSAITVADTYVTLVDATGGGFLFWCVAPTHSANFTPTIRITLDGTVYTIAPTAVFAGQKRLVVGAATPGAPVITTAGTYNEAHIILPNEAPDPGYVARVGGVNSRNLPMALPSEMSILTYGFPCVRFETGMKVEMKASLLSATAVDKQCAVTYRLDV